MGISKGAKKPKASAAEAPPWPAPPPQADTEDQQGLFSMLHTLAQQLEAQKARADTAAARCSALSKEMEEREGRWKKRQRSWRKSHKKHVQRSVVSIPFTPPRSHEAARDFSSRSRRRVDTGSHPVPHPSPMNIEV